MNRLIRRHLNSKYLLSSFSVPGMALDAGGAAQLTRQKLVRKCATRTACGEATVVCANGKREEVRDRVVQATWDQGVGSGRCRQRLPGDTGTKCACASAGAAAQVGARARDLFAEQRGPWRGRSPRHGAPPYRGRLSTFSVPSFLLSFVGRICRRLVSASFSCGTPVDGHSFVVSASASHCLLVGSEQWRRLALGIVTEP